MGLLPCGQNNLHYLFCFHFRNFFFYKCVCCMCCVCDTCLYICMCGYDTCVCIYVDMRHVWTWGMCGHVCICVSTGMNVLMWKSRLTSGVNHWPPPCSKQILCSVHCCVLGSCQQEFYLGLAVEARALPVWLYVSLELKWRPTCLWSKSFTNRALPPATCHTPCPAWHLHFLLCQSFKEFRLPFDMDIPKTLPCI